MVPCLRLFVLLGGTKGSCPVWGCLPSTPPWSDLALLCTAALRYSSLMFPAPLWTSTKACVHPVWSTLAPLPLSSAASRLPSLCFLCVPVSVFLSVPPLLPSPLFLASGFYGGFHSLRGFSLSFCSLSCFGSGCWSVGSLSCTEFAGLLVGSYPILLVFGGLLFTPGCLPPPWSWCLSVLCWSVGVGPPFCFVCFVCVCFWVFGVVGPASCHGLDRTAVNFTGAVQWSSLPCGPERPRAAKTAHMVPSVESIGRLQLAGLR